MRHLQPHETMVKTPASGGVNIPAIPVSSTKTKHGFVVHKIFKSVYCNGHSEWHGQKEIPLWVVLVEDEFGKRQYTERRRKDVVAIMVVEQRYLVWARANMELFTVIKTNNIRQVFIDCMNLGVVRGDMVTPLINASSLVHSYLYANNKDS